MPGANSLSTTCRRRPHYLSRAGPAHSDAGSLDLVGRPTRSGPYHDLDRLALVHRAVAVGNAIEIRDAIEDAAGRDRAFQHVWQQFVDIGAHGCRTAGDDDVV